MLTFGLESLERERQKADALELDYMLGCFETHAELTERADRLEARLLEEQGRSWWRRLFGT